MALSQLWLQCFHSLDLLSQPLPRWGNPLGIKHFHSCPTFLLCYLQMIWIKVVLPALHAQMIPQIVCEDQVRAKTLPMAEGGGKHPDTSATGSDVAADFFSAQSNSVHDAAIFPGLCYNVHSRDFFPVHLDFVFGDAVCCLATGCCHSWKALLEELTRRNCIFKGRKRERDYLLEALLVQKQEWEGCVKVKAGFCRYFTVLG